MTATMTQKQLVPDDIREKWEAGRQAVLTERENSDRGGPPELLDRVAKTRKAYDAWRNPEREYKAALADLQVWQQANTAEFSQWQLAGVAAPVLQPLIKQLERLHSSILQTQDQRSHEETASKARAYLRAKMALSKIHENPPADLEAAIREILAELPPVVSI
jgi:hypothetical protein